MSDKQYAIYKRGKYWYVQFKKFDGSYSVAKSTKKTNKHDAEAFAVEQITNGSATSSKELFSTFAQNFFDRKGPWAIDRLSRGKRLTERYCIYTNKHLENHILPFFGHMKLADIDIVTIKAFRGDLYQRGFAGASINMYLGIVKQILAAAEEAGLIKGVPRIDRAANNPKQKGILTIEEVKALFSINWGDFRGYAASLLSASTGLRLSEVLGLVVEDYHPSEKYIHCRRSWDRITGTLLSTTKTGRARNVMIPQPVIEAVKRLIELSPHPMNKGSFIFWDEKSSACPTGAKIITNSFYSSMGQIGISEEIRKARNITFHSHRHFLNSLLINSNIPLQKVQSITGHLTAEMSQHYYHQDDMSDVQEVQNTVFN